MSRKSNSLSRSKYQRYITLGILVGFSKNTAGVRIAQYETSVRKPLVKLKSAIASALEVNPMAIDIPSLNTIDELIYALFSFEDNLGMSISVIDKKPYFIFDGKSLESGSINEFALVWNNMKNRLKKGEITLIEYNAWRYKLESNESTLTINQPM